MMTTPPRTVTILHPNHPAFSPDHNHPLVMTMTGHHSDDNDSLLPPTTTDYHPLLNPTGHRQILFILLQIYLLCTAIILEEIEIIIIFRPKNFKRNISEYWTWLGSKVGAERSEVPVRHTIL
jgi:hypothetical protein